MDEKERKDHIIEREEDSTPLSCLRSAGSKATLEQSPEDVCGLPEKKGRRGPCLALLPAPKEVRELDFCVRALGAKEQM